MRQNGLISIFSYVWGYVWGYKAKSGRFIGFPEGRTATQKRIARLDIDRQTKFADVLPHV